MLILIRILVLILILIPILLHNNNTYTKRWDGLRSYLAPLTHCKPRSQLILNIILILLPILILILILLLILILILTLKKGAKAGGKKRTHSTILPISMFQYFFCVIFFSLCSNLSYGQVDRLFQMGHSAISASFMVFLCMMDPSWGVCWYGNKDQNSRTKFRDMGALRHG